MLKNIGAETADLADCQPRKSVKMSFVRHLFDYEPALRDRIVSAFVLVFVGMPFLFMGHGAFMVFTFLVLLGLVAEVFSFSRSFDPLLRLKVRFIGSGAVFILLLFFLWTWSASFWTSSWLLYLVPCAWIVDTGAYCGGKIFGGKLLAPKVSPAKTVSGALFGWGLGVLWCLYPLLKNPVFFSYSSLVFILLAPLAVIVGDLVESFLKRQLRLKDTSAWVPGHAGLWDRLDGLLGLLIFVFLLYLFYPSLVLSLMKVVEI